MRIALYYKYRHGGVYRRIREIQKRSKYDVEVVDELPGEDDFDIIHSYSDCYGGSIHSAECNMLQAIDYMRRLSKYAVKYIVKGIDELFHLRGYHTVIAKSDRDYTFLKKFGFNLSLASAGIDTDYFMPVEATEMRDELNLVGRKVALFVGRLEEAKGVNLLLGAAQYLPDDWCLVFIGNPTTKIPKIQDSEKIRYIGPVPHEKLVEYYNAADLFCLPSWTECFPLTVLEALACGKPVVATDVGDIKKMIKPPAGGRICKFNPRDIASKIIEADMNADSNAFRTLALRHQWSDTVRKVEAVWENYYQEYN